jgi:hypothetical protein
MTASPNDIHQVITSTSVLFGVLSGLIGALISAYFSYEVRLRAKAREDAEERRRIAHVHFLALTDVVGGGLFVKLYVERIMKIYDVKPEGFDFSHAAAVFIATKIGEVEADDRAQIRMISKGAIAVITESKVDIDPSDLGRMGDATIYSYVRFQAALNSVKQSLLVLNQYLDSTTWTAKDIASILHCIFRAYARLTQSAGLLRAALTTNANVSSDYSLKCLNRSYTATQTDLAASFADSSKLDLARKAAEELTASKEAVQLAADPARRADIN